MKKSEKIQFSFKLEDFLYLNNIKINLKKNKKSCICEIKDLFIKTKRDTLKPPMCKAKTLMDAFIGMAFIISKQKLYSKDERKKPIKVPKLT
jgi:hypothetical protein